MKLNVATRVIAGFAVVTLLLLLLGAVSWFTNNELKNTTEVLQQLSIPALKSTGELGETLSEQQRLVLVGYHVTKPINSRLSNSSLPVKSKTSRRNLPVCQSWYSTSPGSKRSCPR